MSNSIKGIEIFRTGTHNNDTYTTQDLDDMIAAHRALDFRPALKLGHSKDQPGAPAYGWITNLKRVGQKLYADFEDMHHSVTDAIRDGRYGRVSAEIYFGLKRGEKTYRRALKAVALLGAEVPAVAGLTPLHKMEFVASGFDSVALAAQTPMGHLSAGEELDDLIRAFMGETGTESYSEAMTAVLAENPSLHHSYAMHDSQTAEDMDAQRWANAMGLPDTREERSNAGIQIQKLVIAAIAKNPLLSNAAALKLVLQQNPLLAQAYRDGHGSSLGSNFDTVMGA